MKLSAIRIAEVGRFATPVAIEGLTGGLDVLIGPNEAGKSTVLRALRTVVCDRYSSARREIRDLVPYGGGAPLIEIDANFDGRRRRLRKQFLSGAKAELRDLDSGRVVRNGDAEEEWAELIGRDWRQHRPALLWVDQGEVTAGADKWADMHSGLARRIAEEVTSAAAGSDARRVLAAVRAELAKLQTERIGRPSGAYLAALNRRDQLACRLAEARQRLGEARNRLDRLEALRREEQDLARPERDAARRGAANAAADALAQGRAAITKLREVKLALEAKQEKVRLAEKELSELDGQLAQLASLEELLTRAECDWPVRQSTLAVAEEQAAAARAAQARARRELDASRADAQLARARELRRRLAEARSAEAEVTTAAEALSGMRITEEFVRAAHREASEIRTLDARLAANRPSITVAYMPSAGGRIRVAGHPLADGEVLTPERPLVLEIDSIGTITVAHGRPHEIEDILADRDAHAEHLAALLDKMELADLAAADAALAECRRLQTASDRSSERLAALAPAGVDRLAAKVAAIDTIAETGLELAPIEDLEARISFCEPTHVSCSEAVASTEGEAARLRAELRAHADNAAALRHRVADLAAKFPDLASRGRVRAGRTANLEAARAACNEAVRSCDAWAEQAPGETALERLVSSDRDARAAIEAAARRLEVVRRQAAGVEGELRRDRADDVAAEVDEIGARHAEAEREVERHVRDIAALEMLRSELEAAEADTRDRLLAPVLHRIAPYVALVFPSSRLELGPHFEATSLVRDAGEPIERLSSGTQEQIAVLVRLGLARLLADLGSPAPIVLDDALVYSDDQRIEAMFGALRTAAEAHQVIVLTCRARTFERLPGARLDIVPWDPRQV